MNNIAVVDDIVRKTETVMSEFFGDDETAYVFTADHGMSVIGNHGDGRKSLPWSLFSILSDPPRPKTPTTHARPSSPGARASAGPSPTPPGPRTTPTRRRGT
jgi:hypothetical protein